MISQDITLGAKTYSLTVQRPTSSVRSDPATTANFADELQVSHETSKVGTVSSVMILSSNEIIDCQADACSPVSTTNGLKAMFKLQYNPMGSRTDITADIVTIRAQMLLLLADDTIFAKFLNKES